MKSALNAPSWTRLFLAFAVLAIYLPFLWMIIRAFGGPFDWGFHWFEGVFQNHIWKQALLRSAGVALASSAVSTVIGLGATLALPTRLGRWLSLFSVLSLVLPELVFALALLSWFVVLKVQLSLITVFLAHVTFSISFSFFLINSRYQRLDPDLIEAASDLGATSWQILARVLLPLLKPSMVVSFLICFLLSFDDFLVSFFVSGVGSDTLPMNLYSAMKMGLSPQLNALAALLSFFSATALYLVMINPFAGQGLGLNEPVPK